jgi:hypothetical protein
MAQGYGVTQNQNFLLQDNQSSILLERNGRASSGKRTQHINICYFFITDRVNMKEVEIEWCPTKKMVANFMTKPLQGSHFRRLRDLSMGMTSIKKAMISSKSTVTVPKRLPHQGQGAREKANSCASCEPYKCCVVGTVNAPQECVGVI